MTGYFDWVPGWVWPVERVLVDQARGTLMDLQGFRAPPRGGPLLEESRALTYLRRHRLRQPDQKTCGSSSLTVLRMLRDPEYAALILDQPDPQRVFAAAAAAVLRRTNHARDARGLLQLPWPWIGGTRPAAMIRLLHADLGYGQPGLRYRNLVIDPADPGPVLAQIRASIAAGEPVPFYVGDHRWMQHIVLVVGAGPDHLSIYEPGRGCLERVSIRGLLTDDIEVAGWRRPWLAIVGSPR